MRRKRISILFACGGKGIGGVQNSLLALIDALPANRFDVTLLVDRLGDELGRVPPNVRVLALPQEYAAIVESTRSVGRAAQGALRHPRWALPMARFLLAGSRRNRRRLLEELWDRRGLVPRGLPPELSRRFDVAVAFAGFMGVWNQFVGRELEASKRVCWVHGDVRRLITGTDHELELMKEMDALVTVSDACGEILRETFPAVSDRVHVVYNIVDRGEVIRKSQTELPSPEFAIRAGDDDVLHLVSVSRLDAGKGHMLGLEAIKELVRDGVRIHWLIIGDGPEGARIRECVRLSNLSQNVVLLGKQLNPFPWVASADVFFHPSFSEGHSVAIEEARILGKPVVATAFSTVRDQVEDGVDGMVVDFSVESIANALRVIATDHEFRRRLVQEPAAGLQSRDPVQAFCDMPVIRSLS